MLLEVLLCWHAHASIWVSLREHLAWRDWFLRNLFVVFTPYFSLYSLSFQQGARYMMHFWWGGEGTEDSLRQGDPCFVPGLEEGRASQGLAKWDTGRDTVLGLDATEPQTQELMQLEWEKLWHHVMTQSSTLPQEGEWEPRSGWGYILYQPGAMEPRI